MSIVIVDGRQWQNMFDLRNGTKLHVDNPVIRNVRRVLAEHPYPGDSDGLANQWVTDTALDMVATYRPSLMCLSYARQYFAQRFTPFDDAERKALIQDVFHQAGRFVEDSGYRPVFVGTGDMTPLVGEMDLSMLDALVSSGGGSARYTGLYNPSEEDLAYLASLPGVERLVSQEEWIALFSSAPCDPGNLPDYLLVSREGWAVRSVGTTPRRPIQIQGLNFTIPVATSLGPVGDITDIKPLIDANLHLGPVALIVIEGVGERDFPGPFEHCANGVDWYCYEPSEGQYLTLTSGIHEVFSYPPGHRFKEEMTARREFPFSGFFRDIPTHTVGAKFDGRSVAVGNRSMFTHMVFGAGISIECFSRTLFNQGCIAVVKNNAMLAAS